MVQSFNFSGLINAFRVITKPSLVVPHLVVPGNSRYSPLLMRCKRPHQPTLTYLCTSAPNSMAKTSATSTSANSSLLDSVPWHSTRIIA
ncbi:hypothetical protein BC936DRAFT_142797 [Jimgerdemannia flammicorona]|uniref:Uncharacterized protein n=1 Tax=Jimgerdemannia flammicorona TaxID=994334 RepID=A0A433DEN0_9FUNG|nr:hypothetical protein BC936DRAFT_142797 [Jimgerdemannia flammicorona]